MPTAQLGTKKPEKLNSCPMSWFQSVFKFHFKNLCQCVNFIGGPVRRKRGTEREREREQIYLETEGASMHWFISQMLAQGRARSGNRNANWVSHVAIRDTRTRPITVASQDPP